MRRKLLYQRDDRPARNVQFFREMIEGRPCVTFAAVKVSQVGVELLRFVGDFGPIIEPLRQPNAVELAMRID